MHYDHILHKKLQIFATKTSPSLAKSPQVCSSWSLEPNLSQQLSKASSEIMEWVRSLENSDLSSFLWP